MPPTAPPAAAASTQTATPAPAPAPAAPAPTTPAKRSTRISLSDVELKELGKEFREKELPKRHTCPKCEKTRDRDQFGVRLMNGPALREGKAVLPVFRIQSYCTPCRSIKPKK
jgi:hypothetical protein